MRICSTCTHPQREAIDRELVAGTAIPAIAAKYRVSPDALLRHKQNHLPRTLVKAQEAKETVRADDLLAQLQGLRNKAIDLLMKAEESGVLRTALLAVREARSCVEVLAELEHRLDRSTQVNVLVTTPAWLEARDAMLHALRPYPEARAAVIQALLVLGDGE